jgi:hypothetical protein
MANHKKQKFTLPKNDDGTPRLYKTVGEPQIIVEENSKALCCGQQMRIVNSNVLTCGDSRFRVRYWQCKKCLRTTKTSDPITLP